jgi:chromosome segregation ATPase
MDRREKANLKKELRKLHSQRGDNRTVNFRLMVVIITLLLVLIMLAFYASWRYNELLEENRGFTQSKNNVNNELTVCTTQLNNAVEQLEMIETELNISSASRQSLNTLYANLSDQKMELEGDLSETQSSLSSCQINLGEVESERDDAVNELNDYILQYNKKVTDLQAANVKINDLEEDIDEWEDYADCLNDCINGNCTNCTCSK